LKAGTNLEVPVRRAFALVLAVSVISAEAGAQRGRQSDSLPRDLVNAILGGSAGARSVDVHAGRVDESIPAALFTDASILGIGTFTFMTMTVAYFPYPPQATLDTIHARLLAAGWLAPRTEVTPTRGFIGATGAPDQQAYCHERDMLVPAVSVRNLSRTLAVFTRQWVEGGVPYGCVGRAAQRASPLDDTPIPGLQPPPATSVTLGGVTTGTDTWVGRATISGRLTVAEAMKHYAGQFVAGGWEGSGEVIGEGVAAASFLFTSPDGQRWHCAFMASMPSRPGTINLVLQLSRI
jgi:hypothetical protein